ncbi:MAG: GAF domain-containing protein [Kofleriaceae bacterium]|nr:GAF domain-containing protein [Kofleriaceae bacterium]
MGWDPLALLEGLDESVGVYALDGTVVYANPALERLFGRTLEAMVGKRLWDLFPEAVGNEFHAKFEEARQTGNSVSFDHYYVPWDRWFRNQMLVRGDHVHVVATDITEQKLAELRVHALSLASRTFSRALEPDHLYRELAFALADTIGDGCVVALIDGDKLRAVAVDHHDPVALAAIRDFVARPVSYTEGVSGRVFVTGQSVLMPVIDLAKLRDAYIDDHRREQIGKMGTHSLVAVPFREGERRIGVITLLRDRTKRAYTQRDLALVEDLADRASMAITHVRLYDEAERGRRRASAVAAASRAFSVAERDPRRILEVLAEAVLHELGDCVVASAISADRTCVEPVIAIADFELAAEVRTLLTAQTPLAGSISERVVDTRQPIFTPHVDRALFMSRARPEFAPLVARFAPYSFLMVPIESGGQAIGTLSASRVHSTIPYTREDLALLIDLAGRASLAIENARVLQAERAARRDAEQITEHTRQLQVITSQLSHRRAVKEIAEIVLRDSVGVLRAANAAIWLVDPTGQQIEMLAQDGYREPLRFATLALDTPSPLTASIQTHAPVYISSRAEYLERFPDSAERLGDAFPSEMATATIPLTCEGRAIGGLAVSFQRSHVFSDKERAFLEVLANQCAQAIDRTRTDEKARAADRRKDEFLAMLSHELRNPLAPILTALQLMDLRGETAAVRERQIIERQTRHLGLLVDDLLDLSRITRGTLELRRSRVDLRSVIAQAIEMASPLLEKRNHSLALANPPNPVFVDGDELRLNQVFQNLLTNAAKYTPPGGAIAIRLAPDATIEVEDNGDGITSELLAVMFEPFVQGTRSVDRTQGGLGLGLTLVKSLVALHGGSVSAHSDGAGKGSRFTVSLPLAAAEPAIAPRTIAFVADGPTASGRRILLVDDNEDAAEMLADILRDAGHEVLVAHDGPSALDAASTFTPHVAILDIGLPVMDGYDLARRLRAMLSSPPRFVALTGYGQEHDRRKSSEAGFDAHLVKPVDAVRVLAAIIAASHSPGT